MIRSTPNINTSRLALRGMRPEDFDRYAEIWSMPDVVRNIGGAPWDRRRAWESFLRNAGHWQMPGFGQWAVVDLRSRTMIGQVGFFYGSQELGDDFDSFPQAGWLLVPEAQGNGFALEAARAAHDWFDRVIPGKLVARISGGNAPSLRLADQLGYREIRRIDDPDGDLVLLRRDGPPGNR